MGTPSLYSHFSGYTSLYSHFYGYTSLYSHFSGYAPSIQPFCWVHPPGPYLEKMIGGRGGEHGLRGAEGHCEGEGAGGGCAKLKLPPFYKVNGKLKIATLKMATGSVLMSFYASIV